MASSTRRLRACASASQALLAAAFVALSLAPPISAQSPRRMYPILSPDRVLQFREANERGLDHVPGEVLVKFRDGLSPVGRMRSLASIAGTQAVRDARWVGGVAVVRDRSQRDVRDVAADLASSPDVVYAEPNYLGRTQAVPNDPSYTSRQWNLQQLNMPAAWDITPGGSPGVVIATIDSGITAVAAQQMSAFTWDGVAIVELAVPIAPSPDFALTRFTAAADFTQSESSPSPFVFDSDGHGTHTGSTVGEGTNNGIALAGIAYGATLMPLKACITYWDLQFSWSAAGNEGFYPPVSAQCPTSTTAAAIRYAADHGADVINISLGGFPDSITLFDALTYARNRGVFIAIANGNSFDDGNEPSYPAAYASQLAGVMSVAAVTRTNAHAWYSTTNEDTEIAAYGGDIELSDANGIWQMTLQFDDVDAETVIFPRFDRYEEQPLQGTSMAAPHVAGIAALIHSRGITDPATKEAVITATALDVGPPGRDTQSGAGLVQPRAALFRVRDTPVIGTEDMEITKATEATESAKISIGNLFQLLSPIVRSSVSSVSSVSSMLSVLSALSVSSALAQAPPNPAPPAVGIRAFVVPFQWQRMTASETFDAVTGSSSLIGFGGGIDVLRIAKGLFARVAFSTMAAEGSRVAIIGQEIVPFDPPIRLDVRMTPIEIGAGWRFAERPRPGARTSPSRVVPYVGGGLLLVRYQETSEFDEPDEGELVTFTGAMFFGGIDVSLGGGFIAGGEAQYRLVPNALGDAGVSAHFGETDLSGFVVRALFGYRR